METALVDTSQSRRHVTEQTLGVGDWRVDDGTPLISHVQGTTLDPASFGLAGGDVLARLAGQDITAWLRSWWKLSAAVAPSPSIVHHSRSASALDAVELLMELFEVSMETIAVAAGVGRTTILHWKREGSSPRPSTVIGLWRLHAIALGLRSVLGVAGTRSWLRSGPVAPYDVLTAGDLAAFGRLASTVVFDARPSRAFEPAVPIGDEPVLTVGAATRPARGTRRSRRQSRRA